MKHTKHKKLHFVRIGIINKLVTASKKGGLGQTHLLAIQSSDGFYMSHERNIYDNCITLCGLETDEGGYTKGGMSTTITCKKCLRIINKEGYIVLRPDSLASSG